MPEPTDESPDGDRAPERDGADDVRAHLDDVDDGCGCTEVWEYLSERRDGRTAE